MESHPWSQNELPLSWENPLPAGPGPGRTPDANLLQDGGPEPVDEGSPSGRKPPLPPHWTDCRKELADRLGSVPRLLVATNFDGTLAPLSSWPEEARLPEETHRSLAALVGHPGVRVAVLSSRALQDVAELVNLPKAVLAGNHGLEIKGGGMDYLQPQALAARPVLDAAEEFLNKRLALVPGCRVAHQGLTLAVHFHRTGAEDRKLIEAAAAVCVERFPHLKLHRGRRLMEFRPDVAWNKGFALKRLLKGLGLPAAAALYMGDDATDEDAFAALNGLGTSLHVGTDPEVETRARYRLNDPEDAAAFLDWLKKLRVV